MHLLNIEQSGDLYASGEAVDLGQSPADMVILTAADSEMRQIVRLAYWQKPPANPVLPLMICVWPISLPCRTRFLLICISRIRYRMRG